VVRYRTYWIGRSRPDLQNYSYRALIQATKAPSTANVTIAALRAFSAFLQDAGYRTDNPARKLKRVGRQRTLAPKSLNANEINALLRTAQQAQQQAALKYAVVQLLLQAGLRARECSMLNVRDLQISERQGQVLVRAGKGNDSGRCRSTHRRARRWWPSWGRAGALRPPCRP
jgi:site-specific recombinase XerD